MKCTGRDTPRLQVTALADSVARPVQSTRHPQALEHTERLRPQRSRAAPAYAIQALWLSVSTPEQLLRAVGSEVLYYVNVQQPANR